jgi:2-polyprenyl-3-methyl-5-hydroxy-6-metoxy-1,4-benzoquinol methylase
VFTDDGAAVDGDNACCYIVDLLFCLSEKRGNGVSERAIVKRATAGQAVKYYYREHLLGYQRVKAEGKTAWNEIHGSTGFENFSSRAFLELALSWLDLSASGPTALEYGCGTGPAACFLAKRGFHVDGIDLIPAAIEIAKEQAKARNLGIHYEVMDVCELPHKGKKYDLIVDSYCLQGIVTKADRECVLSAVRARLKPEGYYLISTAMFDEDRLCKEERIADAETGTVYTKYGDGIINVETGIVYKRLEGGPTGYEGTVKIGGAWYLLNRRHRKPSALRTELEAAGFRVLYQSGEYGGDVVCVHGEAGASLER